MALGLAFRRLAVSNLTGGVSIDKIAAYCATYYRVSISENRCLVLRISRPQLAQKALLIIVNRRTGAFATADNPNGARLDKGTHRSTQLRLSQLVAELSETVHLGEGADAAAAWPPEPSLLAIGLALSDTSAIVVEIMQRATFWVDEQCVPELILLQ